MKCWHCETELIWGADHDIEDNDDYSIVTNLSCPECKCLVEVYLPTDAYFPKNVSQMNTSHKDAYRLFWMIKGHLNASEETILNTYDGYFKRVWYNEEAYIHAAGFEEEYNKKENE